MDQKQPDLNQILTSPQASSLLKNKQALEALINSGEAKRLMESLNRKAGSGLQDAARSAMQGDTAQLMSLVQGLMQDPKNAQLAEQLNSKIK